MAYKALHEIIYPDELSVRGTIQPGSILTDSQIKALGPNLADLLKAKAIKETTQKAAKAADPDVVGNEAGAGMSAGDADDADDTKSSSGRGGIFNR